jgi:predicted TIM-barrel fold metal-dependent hydrolase
MSAVASAAAPLMVDSHAHVWLKGMPLVSNPRHRLDYDFSIEKYLSVLAEHRVDYAVLAAASPFGDYNDYTIAAVKGRPRMRATVILQPDVDQYTLAHMKRDGVVGVRLPFVNMPELPDLTTFEYRRTLRRYADLDWHVHLHLDGPRIAQVLPALEASGVKVVIDHFGRPDPQRGVNCEGFKLMLNAIERGRTWVKVSAAYRLGEDLGAVYGRALLQQVGPDRLLWASDCPFAGFEGQMTYQRSIDAVTAWVPEGALRHKIFAENALKLYFA